MAHSARNRFAARSIPALGLLESIVIAKMGAAKYVGAVRRALDSENDVVELKVKIVVKKEEVNVVVEMDAQAACSVVFVSHVAKNLGWRAAEFVKDRCISQLAQRFSASGGKKVDKSTQE